LFFQSSGVRLCTKTPADTALLTRWCLPFLRPVPPAPLPTSGTPHLLPAARVPTPSLTDRGVVCAGYRSRRRRPQQDQAQGCSQERERVPASAREGKTRSTSLARAASGNGHSCQRRRSGSAAASPRGGAGLGSAALPAAAGGAARGRAGGGWHGPARWLGDVCTRLGTVHSAQRSI
jgi:hypothetical protein